MRKGLSITIAVLVAILVIAALGASWYFSGLILDGVAIKGDTGEFDDAVTAISDTTITYTLGEDVDDVAGDDETRGQVGLRFSAGGYLLLGQDATVQGRAITRSYQLLQGPAPTVGDPGKYDWDSFPDAQALGVTATNITYDAPLGTTPAVLAPADQPTTTWAIVVHGRNASVREGLRVLPLLHQRGISTMMINYRDDVQEPGAPHEDGIGNFGVTEWSDLEAAVGYAQAHGAHQILLVGYSMGGGIIASYLEHTTATSQIVGTVLISPAVSLNRITDWGAEQMGLPVTLLRPIIWGAERMTELRSPLDFSAAEYLDNADQWPVPALVTAGTEDDLVPPEAIEEFADALPDGRFQLFDPASHTGEWNFDQPAFDALMGQWLDANIR